MKDTFLRLVSPNGTRFRVREEMIASIQENKEDNTTIIVMDGGMNIFEVDMSYGAFVYKYYDVYELTRKCAEYCDNDVQATKEAWNVVQGEDEK